VTPVDPQLEPEQRQSYRTLNEPTRLLSLSLGAWAATIAAAAVAYAFMRVSPLPWRLNFSTVAILLGAPLLVLILREPGTIGPGRLLVAALKWRIRPSRIVTETGATSVRGAVRLDAAIELVDAVGAADVPWAEDR
jgi:hypothetical protein